MTMDRDIDFGTAVGGAFKFGLRGFAPLLRLGWLPLLVVVAGAALLIYAGATFDGMTRLGEAGETFRMGTGGSVLLDDVTSPAAAMLGGLLVLLGLIGFVPVYVGLIRRAAGQADLPGWRFDGRSWRVIGAVLLLALLAVAGALLAVLPFVGVFAATGDPGGVGIAAMVVAGIALFCAFVFVSVRLTLFVPLAATENRVSLSEAWSATRGKFWVLLGGLIVTGIGAAIIGSILELVGTLLGGALDVGAVLAGVIVVGAFFILSQIVQNLISIGFAGRVAHDLRGYASEDVGEVFA